LVFRLQSVLKKQNNSHIKNYKKKWRQVKFKKENEPPEDEVSKQG